MRSKKSKRRVAIFMAAVLAGSVMTPIDAAAEPAVTGETIYVATTGNDSTGNGTKESPYASLQKAQTHIRELKSGSGLPEGGVTVSVASGTYIISNMSFTSEDSGTADKPITWDAEEGVYLKCKQQLPVDSFTLVEEGNPVYSQLNDSAVGKVYAYSLSNFLAKYQLELMEVPDHYAERSNGIEGVYIDGKKAILSRYPNDEYLETGFSIVNPQIYAEPTAKVLAPSAATADPGQVHEGDTPEPGIISYTESLERIDKWAEEVAPIIKGYFRVDYLEEPAAVTIDKDNNTLTTNHVLQFGIANKPCYSETQNREYQGITKFYGMNLLCELDAENEYYIDRENKLFYVYAENGMTGKMIEYTISQSEMISIRGAEYINLSGFDVEGAKDCNISIAESKYITVTDCVSRLSNEGYRITGGNNCTIRNSKAYDIGASGIRVDGGVVSTLTKADHLVEGCEVYNVGTANPTAHAVEVSGVGNTVRGCYIHDVPHHAITFGSCYATIEFNEIKNAVYASGDAGAIYVGGTWLARGNVVRYNYIHDCAQEDGRLINAIYFDDSISGVECYGNVVENFAGYGFHVAAGRDHKIHDNIVINSQIGWLLEDRNPRFVDGVDTNVTYVAWENATSYRESDPWVIQFPELIDVYVNSNANLDEADINNAQDMKNLYIPYNTVIKNNTLVNTVKGSVTPRYAKYSTIELGESGDGIYNVDVAEELATYKTVLANTETSTAEALDSARTTFLEGITQKNVSLGAKEVSTEEELRIALQTSGEYYLTEDIAISGTGWSHYYMLYTAGTNLNITLDLNGHKIIIPKNAANKALVGHFIACQSDQVEFTLKDSSAEKTGTIENLRIGLIYADAGTFNLNGGNIAMDAGDVLRGSETSAAIFNIAEGTFSTNNGIIFGETWSELGRPTRITGTLVNPELVTAISNGTAQLNITGTPVTSSGQEISDIKTAGLTAGVVVQPQYDDITTAVELVEAFQSTLSVNGNQNKCIKLQNDITLPDTIALHGAGTGSIYLDLNGNTIYMYTDTNSANHSYLTTMQNGYTGKITIADHSSSQTGSIEPANGEIARSLFSINGCTPKITFIGGTYTTTIHGFTLNNAGGTVIEVWEGTFNWGKDQLYAGSQPSSADGVEFRHVNDVIYTKISDTTESKIVGRASTGLTADSEKGTVTAKEIAAGSLEITVTAKEGYEVNSVNINDQPITLTDGKYTLTSVSVAPVIEVSFTEAVVVAEGYTAGISAESANVEAGDVVKIPVAVTHNEESSFNACKIEVSYDDSVLTFSQEKSTLGSNVAVNVENGVLTLVDYGEDKNFGNSVYILAFDTVKAASNSTVELTYAAFNNDTNASTSDLTVAAALSPSSVVLNIAEASLSVSIDSEMFTGDATVAYESDYTFSLAENGEYYDYTNISATMGGQTATVLDNNDGTYTIENVTGALVITADRTPKTFVVAFVGTGGEDAAAVEGNATRATYLTDYKFTMPADTTENYYTLDSITIDGVAYTNYTLNSGVCTISGEDVKGDVVFNITKTQNPEGSVKVTIEGTGVGVATGAEMAVIGESYTLTLAPEAGYLYDVTATMAGETATVTNNGDNKYTIAKVDGAIVFTITRSVDKNGVNVSTEAYVQLDGTNVWLVTNITAVADGKVPTYDGQKMFWSDKYNGGQGAYCYLVVADTLSVEEAKAKLDIVSGTKTTVDYGMDVNMTGKIDASDAQLTYNIYNAMYAGFTENVTVQKYLRADVNGDAAINVNDAAAIVTYILNPTTAE